MVMLRRWLRLWFRFDAPVDRRAYAASGFSLMAFKYASDALIVWLVLGTLWTPSNYLLPLILLRARVIPESHGWLMWLLVAWAMPFAWVGASMTLRRALDAGLPARTGLLFFVPVVNYLWMLLLCLLPSRPVPPQVESGSARLVPVSPVGRSVLAAAPAAALGFAVVLISVLFFGSYLSMLFVGAPVAIGYVAGLRTARLAGSRVSASGAAQLALLLTAGTLLLSALEGVVCVAMAYPLAALLAEIGAAIGYQVAGIHRLPPAHAASLLLALPLGMGVEASGPPAPPREVLSAIEVDAPPEVVWSHVVGFSELPPPHQLVFALGIAYPMRARIDGEGVGAVRYCEFSTGPFVEPITVWEPPHRLGFDVASQPEPMHETSPYRVVHAPHLVNGLRSERGEFRLIPLSDGRTRLEGRTWYRVQMAPQLYWGALSDSLIHAIHVRVLAHVKSLAEADAG